jgi:type IX secretion system PorP/SprF family membrane protein
MKRIIFSGLLGCFLFKAYAQQTPLNSQYMFNSLVLNPAVAGIKEDRVIFRVQNRNQWVGLEGAPVTQTASGHLRIESISVGAGAYIINDVVGPTRQTGLQTAYSYHFPMSGTTNMSFGLGLGIIQYKVDGSSLTTDEPNDNAVLTATEPHLLPDASFGVLYYGESYYAGLSIPHLIGGKIKDSDFKLSQHYMLMGGTVFEATDDVQVEPSALLRFVSPVPLSVDLNLKAIFRDIFWAGISYRTSDAVVMMAGLQLAEKFHFGYSYDITTSGLSQYSKGSHEVMIGFDLYRKGKTGGRRGIRGPSVFL